jgi:hypothetical protein
MAIKVSPLKKIGERLHNLVQISRQIDQRQETQINELNECDELCNQAAKQCMKLLIQGMSLECIQSNESIVTCVWYDSFRTK